VTQSISIAVLVMANFMGSGVSWLVIFLTVTAFKSFRTEDATVLADPGGSGFVLSFVLFFAWNESRSGCIRLIALLLWCVQMGPC